MKSPSSRFVVLRSLFPVTIALIAGCSSSEPAPAPGTAGSAGASAGVGGNGGAAGSPVGGAAGSGGTGGSVAGTGGAAGLGGSGGGPVGGGGIGGGGIGGGGGTAGGSAGSGGAGGEVTYGAAFKAVAELIQRRCASECHGMQEGFESRNDLRTADLGRFYTHLTTPLMTDICYGKTLVVPGDAAASALIAAVKDEEPNCAIEKMPVGCQGDACLSAADIAMLESWIASGAPKN